MSQPTELEDMTKVEQLLCPRFIVEQMKEDGTKKLRAIDNLSWGAKSAMDASLQERPSKKMRKSVSVNGHVSVNEKLKHHTLDNFVQLLRAFYRSVGCLPAMLKADIDAAGADDATKPASWLKGLAELEGRSIAGDGAEIDDDPDNDKEEDEDEEVEEE